MQHLRNAITIVASGKEAIFRREVTLDEARDSNEMERKELRQKGVMIKGHEAKITRTHVNT
jgi:hypothetical protein